MSALVYIGLIVGGLFSYVLLAGVIHLALPRLYDKDYWDGYGAPGLQEMALAWPITIVCTVGYWFWYVAWNGFAFVYALPRRTLARRKTTLPVAKVVER